MGLEILRKGIRVGPLGSGPKLFLKMG